MADALRTKERRGEIVAMQVEMRQAWIQLHSLLADQIAAPLYRLPLTIFKQALPKLIGEEELTPDEVSLLVEYVNRAEELNRGLDRAGAAHAAHEEVLLQEEFGRLCLKGQALLGDEGKSLFSAAQTALVRLQASSRAKHLPQ